MKLSDLTEMQDQSDYRRGDESNPRSPYYDPTGRVGRQPRHGSTGRDDGPSDMDKAEDERAWKQRQSLERRAAATSYVKRSGTTQDGARYNLVVVINSQAANAIADAWERMESNIYTKVVGRERDEGSVYLFVNAAPQSLVWNATR